MKARGNPNARRIAVCMLEGIRYLLLLAIIFSSGCTRRSGRQVSTGFYYWRTELGLSGEERNRIDALGVRRIYMRFFDIDWDLERAIAYPVSVIHGHSDTTLQVDVVPTIFITNRTFTNISSSDVGGLAEKIVALTLSTASSLGVLRVTEVQLDCDWTEKTRDKYFQLAEEVKRMLREKGIALSATIRLHQAKFREITGVPPVTRGVLMFYNMGKLDDPGETNSILDLDEARKYMPYIDDYPLPLDVALPLYSWGVVYRRGRVAELVNNISPLDFSDQARFRMSGDRIEVLQSTFFNYRYLYKGDMIRCERVSPEKLQEAASLIARHMHSDSLRVIFYHLDSRLLYGYSNENLKALCASMR